MEKILKEMAAKIKLSQHFFFDLVQELSNKPHIFKGIVSRPSYTAFSDNTDDSD
jgi:hypothetical protein